MTRQQSTDFVMEPDTVAFAGRSASVNFRVGGNEYPFYYDPRCKTCKTVQHGLLARINTEIIMGTSYRAILDRIPEGIDVSIRSLQNHGRNHIPLDQAAIRASLDNAIEATGVSLDEWQDSMVTHLGLADAVMQEAFRNMAKGLTFVDIDTGLKAAALKLKAEEIAGVAGGGFDRNLYEGIVLVQRKMMLETCTPEQIAEMDRKAGPALRAIWAKAEAATERAEPKELAMTSATSQTNDYDF